MKSKLINQEKILMISIIITILQPSCQKNDTGADLTTKEIALEMASDPKVHEFYEESKQYLFHLHCSLMASNLDLSDIEAIDSIGQLNQLLQLPEKYLNDHYRLLAEKGTLLLKGYKFQYLTQADFDNIFDELTKIQYSPYQRIKIKSDSCDDKFEEDFDRIHASFDRGVYLCLFTGLIGGASSITLCEAVNLYKTIYDIALAIDEYNNCVQN